MNSTEEADRRIGALTAQNCELLSRIDALSDHSAEDSKYDEGFDVGLEAGTIETDTLRAKLAEAAKIIKPFADMRALCGENERESIMARMLSGVDQAWEDRRVCLEVRHLTAALCWIKENGNG